MCLVLAGRPWPTIAIADLLPCVTTSATAAVVLLPLGEERLIWGEGVAVVAPPVVRGAGVELEACGAVTVAVAADADGAVAAPE